MAPAVQGELRLARVAGVFSLLASLAACGGSSALSFPACDLNGAPELLSLTVQNTEQESLRDYPVAISLDETVFDFAVRPKTDLTWRYGTRRRISRRLPGWSLTIPQRGKGCSG
jgi:predicted small lipoprotein YifL